MKMWYISFASDEGFLGATCVSARDPAAALITATALDRNPGGEAAIIEIPPDKENEPDVLVMLQRLCDEATMRELGGIKNKELPQWIQDRFDEEATYICERHNARE